MKNRYFFPKYRYVPQLPNALILHCKFHNPKFHDMDRRNFLRISALGAMSAACSASGLSKVFAQSGSTPAKIEDGEIRQLVSRFGAIRHR